MNREVGFGRKVLQILEDLNIRWEHMPTGIDDLSIVVRERELTPIKEEEILRQLNTKMEVDKAEIEHGLSIIMIVGENMKSHVGVTATATTALSKQNVNLAMISQEPVKFLLCSLSKPKKRNAPCTHSMKLF